MWWCPFDQIFEAVKSGRAAVGLIIHEGQLTYAARRFRQAARSRRMVEREDRFAAAVRRQCLAQRLPPEVQRDLAEIIRESIDYGLAHREAAVRHSLPYARDMDAALAGKFIGMYVNDYTRDYGETGRAAIREFLRRGSERGFVPAAGELEFVE